MTATTTAPGARPLEALREHSVEEFIFHLEKARTQLHLSTPATGLYLLAGLKALDEVFVTAEEMDQLADYNRHAIFELMITGLIKPTYVYQQDEEDEGAEYSEPAYYLPLTNHPDNLPTAEDLAQAQEPAPAA